MPILRWMGLFPATRMSVAWAPHTQHDLHFIRRCGVGTFAIGAIALASTLLLPDPDKSDHLALTICIGLLALGAVVTRLVPPTASRTRLMTIYGVLVVSAIIAVARPIEATPFFYVWPIVLSSLFLSRRDVAIVLGFAWVSLAVVLAFWAVDPMKGVLFMGTSVSVTLVAVTLTLLRERLALASSTDHLTGLLNRRAFDSELTAHVERSRRSGQPLALALFDLDHFKQINDRFGHAAGDRALARFATLLEDERRAGDTIARIGGEEFAVVLAGSDADGALEFATRVGERLRQETATLAGEPPLSVSAGVTELGDDDTASSLLVAADRALYGAKSAGRHRVGVWSGGVRIGATIAADPLPA